MCCVLCVVCGLLIVVWCFLFVFFVGCCVCMSVRSLLIVLCCLLCVFRVLFVVLMFVVCFS